MNTNEETDKDNLEGPGRTPEQMAAEHRELDKVAPTPGDKFRLMFGQKAEESDGLIPSDLIRDGFSPKMPYECGLWMMACNETDYETHYVAIYFNNADGEHWVHDPENGTATRWRLTDYHNGLTSPAWRIEP